MGGTMNDCIRENEELGRGWLGVWFGWPQYDKMPRAIEAVGGLISIVLVGEGIVSQVYNMGSDDEPSYETDPEDRDDAEMAMIFSAGRFAIECMCRRIPDEVILPTAFGMRMVASIAEKLRGNRDEIKRLATQLRSEDILTVDDIDLSRFKG